MKSELEICQVLIAADGDRTLAAAFDALCTTARKHAGRAAHDAWETPPPEEDASMNRPALFQALKPFSEAKDRFADDLRHATLPQRHRLADWARAHAPMIADPESRTPARVELPHDRPSPPQPDPSDNPAASP